MLANNVDQVIVVFAAAKPQPKWNLLDRYLVMTEAVELPVFIVITKADLLDDAQMREEIDQHLEVYQNKPDPVLIGGTGGCKIRTSSSKLSGLPAWFVTCQ
jgi:putative ribosome biogenesis GTPase RsgA